MKGLSELTRRKSSNGGNHVDDNTKLFQLLLDKKWDKALSRLKKHPEEASMTGKCSGLSLYPLHLICLEQNGSYNKVLVALVQRLLECFPTAAAEHVDGDVYGRLPLHVALANGVMMDVIQLILDVRREVSMMADFENNLPLHIALQTRCDFGLHTKASKLDISVLQELVKMQPTSIYASNNQGLTPLQIAVTLDDIRIDEVMHLGVCLASTQQPTGSSISNKNNITPTGSVTDHVPDLNILAEQEKLLARFVSCHKSKQESKPRKYVEPINSNSLYKFIAKSDWNGALNHLLINPKEAREMWVFDDGRKMYPLYVVCAGKPTLDIFARLVDLSPESVKSPDKDGRLPIHVGAMYDLNPSAVQVLVDVFPDSVFYLDHHGKEPHSYAVEYDASEELKQILLGAMYAKNDTKSSLTLDNALQEKAFENELCYKNMDRIQTDKMGSEATEDQIHNEEIRETEENGHKDIPQQLNCRTHTPISRATRNRLKKRDEPSHVEGIWTYEETAGKKVMDSPLHNLILAEDWVSAAEVAKSHEIEATFWIVTNVDGIVWKRLPLHEACKKKAPSNVIDALLRAYPTSAGYFDNLKMLPIHYACSPPGVSLATIEKLLSVSPNCARFHDKEGRSLRALVEQWDTVSNPDKQAVVGLLMSTSVSITYISAQDEVIL